VTLPCLWRIATTATPTGAPLLPQRYLLMTRVSLTVGLQCGDTPRRHSRRCSSMKREATLRKTDMRSTTIAGLALATLAPLAAAQPAFPPADAARDLAASCAICHGTNGVSAGGGMPQLAGQSKETLARHLKDFRDGKRPATIMHQIAKGYSDEQLELLAAYFAAQKAPR
jgi:sulfide dehydrogenase cytochrome subunit